MSLLEAHLEQIKISCQGIDALPFPPPKIFTNALLSKHDITSLIRDTEPHERALFSVPPPPPGPTPSSTSSYPYPRSSSSSSAAASRRSRTPADDPHDPTRASRRRQTIFNVAAGEITTGPSTRAPRRHTAVAAVLGGEMHDQLRRGEAAAAAGSADRKGDLDVDVLLRGAEKLCTVYELPGARERIAALRTRFRNGSNTLAYYEGKVAEQGEQLAAMHADRMGREDEEGGDEEEEGEGEGAAKDGVWTEEDLRREEEEARLMEARKRELQMRLKSMQKDLGGLRDM